MHRILCSIMLLFIQNAVLLVTVCGITDCFARALDAARRSAQQDILAEIRRMVIRSLVMGDFQPRPNAF